MRRAAGGAGPPAIRLLQLTAFVATFDRFAMPPMLVAIAASLDVPLSQVVHAAGAYFLAYGLSQPVWGVVSDALGLVRTMRLTLVLAAVATTASAFAWSPESLGVTRGLAGAFFGAAFPSSLVYLGDTVPHTSRQHEITRLMVGVALGTALASVGAGIVADVASWRIAFVVTGAAAFGLVLALVRLPEPGAVRHHRHLVSPVVAALRSPWVLLVLLLAFTEGAVLLGALTVLPAAVESTGTSAAVAGAAAAGYGLAVWVAAPLVGRLSQQQPPHRLVAAGAVLAFGAFALMTVSQAAPVALAVACVLGLAWVAMHSTLQTWATEVLPPARATVVSLFAGSLFAGSAVAAVVLAGPAEAGDYDVVFGLAAAATVPLGVLGTVGRARWRRPELGPR